MKEVLIVCGAGASSGFLARNVRIALKKRGLENEYSVIARSDSELEEYIDEIDMLLIGPHLKYLYPEEKKYCEEHGNIPVYVIDQKTYGGLNGEAIVDFIVEKFNENTKESSSADKGNTDEQ